MRGVFLGFVDWSNVWVFMQGIWIRVEEKKRMHMYQIVTIPTMYFLLLTYMKNITVWIHPALLYAGKEWYLSFQNEQTQNLLPIYNIINTRWVFSDKRKRSHLGVSFFSKVFFWNNQFYAHFDTQNSTLFVNTFLSLPWIEKQMASSPRLGPPKKDLPGYLVKDRRRAALSLDFALVLDVLLKGSLFFFLDFV